ncbi:MAG: adenosylmethionine--8-amino-7-oxononanoate transaminase [Planctomycetota bacterium]
MSGAGERRARLEALDDAHLWHPFTPMSVYREEEPLLVEAAEGHELIDVDGRRYLDGVSSIWCTSFGHGQPRILAAMHAQLDRLQHATLLGHANAPAIELAARLAALAPGALERVFFSDNGSTAVEIALKMAFQYQRQCGGGAGSGRRRFLRIAGAYHGDTLGAVGLGGIGVIHDRFRELTFDALELPHPSPAVRPAGVTEEDWIAAAFAAVDRVFEEHGPDLAAVVVEPGFQGAGGILVQPPGWLAHLAERARSAGVLVIFDEVAVGIGRSGRLFAAEREGIEPDFLCLAKALTAGYSPLAATITTERVYRAFLGAPAEGRTFLHGHTFTGHPLGAAAALATLDLIRDEGLIERLERTQAYFAARVRELGEEPGAGEPRIYGLAAGIDLLEDVATRRPHDPSRRTGIRAARAARDAGVFLRPLGDTLVLFPPLTIDEAEIDRLVAAARAGIRAVAGALA